MRKPPYLWGASLILIGMVLLFNSRSAVKPKETSRESLALTPDCMGQKIRRDHLQQQQPLSFATAFLPKNFPYIDLAAPKLNKSPEQSRGRPSSPPCSSDLLAAFAPTKSESFSAYGPSPLFESSPSETSPIPISPEIKDSQIISLAALYWQVIQDNLISSIKANGVNSSGLSSLVWINQKSTYAPGFRASYTYPLSYDNSLLKLSYTLLHAQSFRLSKNPDPEFYMILSGQMQAKAREVESTWEIHFQSLEVLFAENWALSPHLSMTPGIGLKGLYPSQEWCVFYKDPLIALDEQIFLKQRMKNFFWSLGPQFSIPLKLTLPKQWTFSFSSSWSLLCGKLYSQVIYTDLASSGNLPLPNTSVKGTQKVTNIIPQMEIWLGAKWSYPIDKRKSLDLELGYDMQYFWGAASLLAFIELPRGNLMMHGLTGGLQFHF